MVNGVQPMNNIEKSSELFQYSKCCFHGLIVRVVKSQQILICFKNMVKLAGYSKNTFYSRLLLFEKVVHSAYKGMIGFFPHSFHVLCGPRFFGGEFNLFKQRAISFEPLQQMNGMNSLLLIFH